jgi:hypothetical protein
MSHSYFGIISAILSGDPCWVVVGGGLLPIPKGKRDILFGQDLDHRDGYPQDPLHLQKRARMVSVVGYLLPPGDTEVVVM